MSGVWASECYGYNVMLEVPMLLHTLMQIPLLSLRDSPCTSNHIRSDHKLRFILVGTYQACWSNNLYSFQGYIRILLNINAHQEVSLYFINSRNLQLIFSPRLTLFFVYSKLSTKRVALTHHYHSSVLILSGSAAWILPHHATQSSKRPSTFFWTQEVFPHRLNPTSSRSSPPSTSRTNLHI